MSLTKLYLHQFSCIGWNAPHTPVLLAKCLVTAASVITYLVTVSLEYPSLGCENKKTWHTHGLPFLSLFGSIMDRIIASLQLEARLEVLIRGVHWRRTDVNLNDIAGPGLES